MAMNLQVPSPLCVPFKVLHCQRSLHCSYLVNIHLVYVWRPRKYGGRLAMGEGQFLACEHTSVVIIVCHEHDVRGAACQTCNILRKQTRIF